MRVERLANLGFVASSSLGVLTHSYGLTINVSDIQNLPVAEWDVFISAKNEALASFKIEQEKKDNYDCRVNELAAMSFSFTGEGDIVYGGRAVGITEAIALCTPEKWAEYLIEINGKKAEIDADIAKAKEAKAIADKEAADKAAQELADKIIADKEAADKAAKVLADKIIADKAAADKAAKDAADKAEAERVSNLSDKNKVKEYAQKLLQIELPATTTAKWTKEVNALIATIKNFQA